jgi:transcriptional regulator with XRE-family HTH domain
MPDTSSDEDAKLIFGRRLRELRQARNLSQEALAAEAGLDRTYISSCERGHRNVSLENIYRIARALDVLPEELLRKPMSYEPHSVKTRRKSR